MSLLNDPDSLVSLSLSALLFPEGFFTLTKGRLGVPFWKSKWGIWGQEIRIAGAAASRQLVLQQRARVHGSTRETQVLVQMLMLMVGLVGAWLIIMKCRSSRRFSFGRLPNTGPSSHG